MCNCSTIFPQTINSQFSVEKLNFSCLCWLFFLSFSRLKTSTGAPLIPWWCRRSDINASAEAQNQEPKQRPAEELPVTAHANPQVWIWLKNVNTPATPGEPIPFPPSVSIENYYTNTDDNISSPSKVSEVLYEEISGIGWFRMKTITDDERLSDLIL